MNLESVIGEVFNRHHQKTSKDDPVYIIATVLELAAVHYGQHMADWLAQEMHKQRLMMKDRASQDKALGEKIVTEGSVFMVKQVQEAAEAIVADLPRKVVAAAMPLITQELHKSVAEMRKARATTLIAAGVAVGVSLVSVVYIMVG
ncbi:MAG: hypothetical protein ACREEY_11730 [Brevundimonas sp.]